MEPLTRMLLNPYTVHKYKNIGDEGGKLLVIGIPAGFEDFFKELGVPVTDEKNFTPHPILTR